MADKAANKKDLLDQLDEADDTGRGSGKGVFCQVEIGLGIKSFASGLTPEQSFMSYVPSASDKDAEKNAIEVVSSFLQTAGIDITAPSNRPTKVVYYHCFASTVVGGNWKGDLFKLIPTWTQAWRLPPAEKGGKPGPGIAKAALGKLIEEGKFLGFGKKYWSHVHVAPDPSGRKDAEGKPQTVWFVDEIYSSEAEMKKAASEVAESEPVDAVKEAVPEGWPADVWAQTKPEIVAKCTEAGWKTPALVKIGKDYDLPMDFLKSLQPA